MAELVGAIQGYSCQHQRPPDLVAIQELITWTSFKSQSLIFCHSWENILIYGEYLLVKMPSAVVKNLIACREGDKFSKFDLNVVF